MKTAPTDREDSKKSRHLQQFCQMCAIGEIRKPAWRPCSYAGNLLGFTLAKLRYSVSMLAINRRSAIVQFPLCQSHHEIHA